MKCYLCSAPHVPLKDKVWDRFCGHCLHHWVRPKFEAIRAKQGQVEAIEWVTARWSKPWSERQFTRFLEREQNNTNGIPEHGTQK